MFGLVMKMNEEMIEKLKKIARRTAWSDEEDFVVDDYAGGNVDDAYSGGERDGEIQLARVILHSMNISWQ